MALNFVINRFLDLRKRSYLKLSYQKKYAFVGIGSHSINNLYPVLAYLRVPIKYIVTKSKRNADLLQTHWPGVIPTVNLDQVLTDESIGGVFICTQSANHFDLARKALTAGKNVFVEKPPCQNIEELKTLIETQAAGKVHCLVGLQKRYSPPYTILKKRLQKVISYNYKFLLGRYPEGNSLLEIFIHPIDSILFLFGPAELVSCQFSHENRTALIQTRHSDGVIGTLELSTEYSWNNPVEELTVNTSDEIVRLLNMNEVSVEKKPGTLLGIPIEKVMRVATDQSFLFRKTDVIPTLANNPIFTSGYFSEIESFVKLCESGNGKNRSALADLIPTYEFLHQIEIKKNV